MDWQQIVALGVVAATAAAFLAQHFYARKSALACKGGCGCASADQKAPPPSVTFTARKGAGRQVSIKAK